MPVLILSLHLLPKNIKWIHDLDLKLEIITGNGMYVTTFLFVSLFYLLVRRCR